MVTVDAAACAVCIPLVIYEVVVTVSSGSSGTHVLAPHSFIPDLRWLHFTNGNVLFLQFVGSSELSGALGVVQGDRMASCCGVSVQWMAGQVRVVSGVAVSGTKTFGHTFPL